MSQLVRRRSSDAWVAASVGDDVGAPRSACLIHALRGKASCNLMGPPALLNLSVGGR